MLLVVLAAARYAGLPDEVRAARQAARQLSNQAAALRPAALDQAALDRLGDSLRHLEASIMPLQVRMSGDPVVAIARSMPLLGPQVDAADALVASADALVEAGHIGLDLGADVVRLREANEADPEFQLMPGLVELMAESGDRAEHLAELVTVARGELASIPDDALADLVEARDLVGDALTTYGPLLDDYVAYDDVLPGILGWGGEKRYLVLAQNAAELRPTGGYSGTVGIVTLRDGALVEQRFQDVHELSRQPGLPFIEAPEALETYLLGEDQSWRVADANWAADFREAAQDALELYAIEAGDTELDGVIAITTTALDRLLEVVGPVSVPQYDLTIEPGDATLTLLGATRGSPGSLEGRKEVLEVLARRLTNSLLGLPPGRWIATAEALEDIGRERMALVWLKDADAQLLVEEAGWHGAVREDAGDYLYVVESNVSPTSKYNLVIERADSLVVRLDEQGDAVNSLRLDWQNDAGQAGEPYRSLRSFSNNEDGWYGAYVRVLMPEDAELVTASGQASDEIRSAEQPGMESGRAVYANYLLMPPGPSTLSYLWTVPGVAQPIEDGWRYELVMQRQPGAGAHSVTIAVEVPAGATITEVGDGGVVEDGRALFERQLDADVEVFVEYALPS